MNQIARDKLAAAASALARDIESGKFKMKFLGRSVAFRDNGAPQCAVGQLIVKAGLKSKLRPFKGISYDGGIGARWWSSQQALEHLLGLKIEENSGLEEAIGLLVNSNDILNGERRRREVVEHLRSLAECLSSESSECEAP